MIRHTKSKIEAIKPDQQDFDAVEKEYGPLRQPLVRRRSPSDIGWLKLLKSFANWSRSLSAAKQRVGSLNNNESRGGDSAAKLLTKDEARRIAVNIAKLLDSCGKSSGRPTT